MQLLKNKKLLFLLDQALFSGASFLITVLLARLLSLEAFGIYSGYVLGIYLLVSAISAFVIQPFQVAQDTMPNQKAYFTFVFWLQITVKALLFLVLYLVISLFFQKIPFTILLFAAGFMFQDFGRKFLMVIDKPIQTLLFDFVTILGLLAMLFLFSKSSQDNISYLLKLFSFAYSVPIVLFICLVKPFSFHKTTINKAFALHYREGRWLFFTALTQWWSGNLFVVAAGVYLGAAALGALRLAQSLMGVLNIVLQTFENYILPQTALKINLSFQDGLRYLVHTTKKAGLFFLLVLAVVFAFAEEILVLAGGQAYQPFYFVLQGMALLYVLIFISQPLRILFRALLLNKHFFYGYLFSLFFSILFSKLLLSNLELYGAILGLASSQVILIFYWYIILHKRKIHLWKSFTSF